MSSSATLQTIPAPVAAASNTGMKAGAGAVVFFLMWSFIWILFFSFRPSIVRSCDEQWQRGGEGTCDNRPADPARCLVASLIVTLIIMIIIWLCVAAK